jgi:hypothetical protein
VGIVDTFHWAGKLPYLVGIPSKNPSYASRVVGSSRMGSEGLGGACILARTSSERVSGNLALRVSHDVWVIYAVHSLEDFAGSSGLLNALLFGIDQLFDVAIHRILRTWLSA